MSILDDIEKAKEKRELAKALRNLMETSRDFKLVFSDHYLTANALDLLYSKSSGINTHLIDKKLDAVTELKAFMDEVLYNGDIADRDIREGYQQLNEDKEV